MERRSGNNLQETAHKIEEFKKNEILEFIEESVKAITNRNPRRRDNKFIIN